MISPVQQLLTVVIVTLTLLICFAAVQVFMILYEAYRLLRKLNGQLEHGAKSADEVAQKIVDKAISITNFGRHIAGKS